jgi:hypothetical protein
MPLRVLVYAALYWEQEWKAWEARHDDRQPLCLTPIIPIVFHTGRTPWRTNRSLAELIAGPEEVRLYAPEWSPLFLDIAERTPEEWLQSAGEWMAAMAVVRAERAEAEAFREVFAAVLKRLERLSATQTVRWHELLHFVLSWGLRRRSGRESEALLAIARSSHADARWREEITRMSETIWKSRDEEVWEEAQATERLRNSREILCLLLEERFGPLPEALVRQIEAVDDLERLRAGLKRVLRVTTLEEFEP